MSHSRPQTPDPRPQTKLILIRHGETNLNQKKQYQGHLDHSLNETGLEQAESLASALHDHYQIDAIYCSPLKRAMQTAQAVANEFMLEPVIIKDLIELDFGKWDGLTYDEIAKDYPIKKWFGDPSSVDIENGEKWSDFNERITNVFEGLSQLDHGTIAVISHAGVIRNFLASLLNLKGLDMFKFDLNNGGFSEVLVKGGHYIINFINEDKHLMHLKSSLA